MLNLMAAFLVCLLWYASNTFAATVLVPINVDEETVIFAPNVTFRLWQLRSDNEGQQMMSYVVETGRNGLLIVIDGGMAVDRHNLEQFLQARRPDKVVTAWFISHPHPDHVGALAAILDLPAAQPLTIGSIYGSFLTDTEISNGSNGCNDQDSADSADYARNFNAKLVSTTVSKMDLKLGMVMYVDGVKIEVLGVKNPEFIASPACNFINDSSVVLRVSDGARSVLFTGDLGTAGAAKLVSDGAVPQYGYAARLPSDYVQMAHHGNQGATAAFYHAVSAPFCLWPTTYSIYTNTALGNLATNDYTAYQTRLTVESTSLCGPPNSGRHFRPFEFPWNAALLRSPYYQEIP